MSHLLKQNVSPSPASHRGFSSRCEQKDSSTDGQVLLAGSEVSAVCCNRQGRPGGDGLASNMESKDCRENDGKLL